MSKEYIAREHPEWMLTKICQENANKTGVYAAIITTFTLLPVTTKLGVNRNKALFSSLAAASVAAYFAARYSFAKCQKQNEDFFKDSHNETDNKKSNH